jgi:hypothetical protein
MIVIRYNYGVKIEEEKLLDLVVVNQTVNDVIKEVNGRQQKNFNNIMSSIKIVEKKCVS